MIPKSVSPLDLEPGEWFNYISSPEHIYCFLMYQKAGWFTAARYNRKGVRQETCNYNGNGIKVMYLGKDIPQCFVNVQAVASPNSNTNSAVVPGVSNVSEKSSPILESVAGRTISKTANTRRTMVLEFKEGGTVAMVIESDQYKLDFINSEPNKKEIYIIQTQVDSACDWQSQYRGSGFEHPDPAYEAAKNLSRTLTGKVRVYNVTTGRTRVIYENGWESPE